MSDLVYQRITNEFIRALEAGTVPWRKPWTSGLPTSFYSKKPYEGINSVLLAMTNHKSVFWATEAEVKRHEGAAIRDEAEYMPVLAVTSRVVMKKDKRSGEEKKVFLRSARYIKVYNADDITGVNFPTENYIDNFKPSETMEAIFTQMQHARRMHEWDTNACYYTPCYDEIMMQNRVRFETEEKFYSVKAHELVHSTGHPSRLNRPAIEAGVKSPFWNTLSVPEYAFEELVAEIGSAMLLARAGVRREISTNNAAYVAHWLQALKKDPKAIVRAASQAQAAVHSILNEEIKYDEEEDDQTPHSEDRSGEEAGA